MVMNTEVTCPGCWQVFDILDRCKHGMTLDDFRYKDGWLVPTHHEPGTPMLCDGTNEYVPEGEAETS